MKNSYKIVLKNWAKYHPEFFWMISMGIGIVAFVVWFGIIGPVMFAMKSDISILLFVAISIVVSLVGAGLAVSFLKDLDK